jgi:two-component sensor histidine kinase
MSRKRQANSRGEAGEGSATTLALVVQELATNSMKYGALSSGNGTLEVSGIADVSEFVLTWTERGGPPVAASVPQGFGSQLATKSITGQLGGTIAFDWPTEGVIVTVRISKTRLGE